MCVCMYDDIVCREDREREGREEKKRGVGEKGEKRDHKKMVIFVLSDLC